MTLYPGAYNSRVRGVEDAFEAIGRNRFNLVVEFASLFSQCDGDPDHFDLNPYLDRPEYGQWKDVLEATLSEVLRLHPAFPSSGGGIFHS